LNTFGASPSKKKKKMATELANKQTGVPFVLFSAAPQTGSGGSPHVR
jgi:hypothetical protein